MFWRMRGIPSGVLLVFDVSNIAADLTVAWLGPNALVPLPSSREREHRKNEGVYKSDYEYLKILTLGIKMPNGTHYFAYSRTQKLPNQDFLRREGGWTYQVV